MAWETSSIVSKRVVSEADCPDVIDIESYLRSEDDVSSVSSSLVCSHTMLLRLSAHSDLSSTLILFPFMESVVELAGVAAMLLPENLLLVPVTIVAVDVEGDSANELSKPSHVLYHEIPNPFRPLEQTFFIYIRAF